MADDCQSPDKCTCLETTILCQNIFATTPILRVLEPEKVTRFYLTNSEIDSLNILDQFQNLKLFSLHTDVRINCTLVYRKMETTPTIEFDVANCPGKDVYYYYYSCTRVCVGGGCPCICNGGEKNV